MSTISNSFRLPRKIVFDAQGVWIDKIERNIRSVALELAAGLDPEGVVPKETLLNSLQKAYKEARSSALDVAEQYRKYADEQAWPKDAKIYMVVVTATQFISGVYWSVITGTVGYVLADAELKARQYETLFPSSSN